MAAIIEVVEFEFGGEQYAIDIHLVREIVEMIQITQIPRAPPHISGVINLRGEITNIMNLNTLLGLKNQEISNTQKIIVLVPEAAGGSNVGIIVDDVASVLAVSDTDIERIGEGLSTELTGFVKGIIKLKTEEGEKTATKLIIWIDMEKVLNDLAKNIAG